MDGEERGLLGNLPRSRPGTRSEKRGEPAAPEPPSAAEPEQHGDLVGDTLRTVARTAGDVTREILRRLPRP